MPTRMERPGKYDPLLRWLQALPADQEHAHLSLGHIEDIIETPLPAGAASSVFWRSGPRAQQHWCPLGFRATFDRFDRCVTFTRVQL
jgi:hypothetical protein